MKPFLLAFCVFLLSSQSQAQTTVTGDITTLGKCSPVVLHPKAKVEITCDGIGKEQGDKIVALLNTVLKNKDMAGVNAKLDEIIAIAARPTQVQTCIGSACVQGFGQATLNQYGAPKLLMTDDQRDQIRDTMKPYAGMVVGIFCNNATDDSMAYAIQLAKGLNDAGLKAGPPMSGMAFAEGSTAIPSGVTVTVGDDAIAAANSLGLAMLRSGLIIKPIPRGSNPNDKLGFQIMITPNR